MCCGCWVSLCALCLSCLLSEWNNRLLDFFDQRSRWMQRYIKESKEICLYATFFSSISSIYRTPHHNKHHRRRSLYLAILPRPSNGVSSVSNLSLCPPLVHYGFLDVNKEPGILVVFTWCVLEKIKQLHSVDNKIIHNWLIGRLLSH